MFRIDKTSVEYLDTNKSNIVVKRWVNHEVPVEEGQVKLEEPLEAPPQGGAPIPTPEEITQQAHQQAHIIISQAQNSTEQIRQSAWQEGFAMGMQEAKQEQLAALEQAQREFTAFIDQMRGEILRTNDQLQELVLELSVEIAEKIVNLQLEKNDTIYMRLVQSAVERFSAKEAFTIHVNQREFDCYFAQGSGWVKDIAHGAPFTIVVNPDIKPGGCRILSQNGMLRAGVDDQLARIAKSLEAGKVSQENPV